jgi:hypothetical protein
VDIRAGQGLRITIHMWHYTPLSEMDDAQGARIAR